jgi:hypothetical protein
MKKPKSSPINTGDEHDFQARLMVALSKDDRIRVWSQRIVTFAVKDELTGAIKHMVRSGLPKGASDISGIYLPEGWRIEIECKDSRKHLRRRTKEQEAWATFIKGARGVYALVDAKDGVEAAVVALKFALMVRMSKHGGGGE